MKEKIEVQGRCHRTEISTFQSSRFCLDLDHRARSALASEIEMIQIEPTRLQCLGSNHPRYVRVIIALAEVSQNDVTSLAIERFAEKAAGTLVGQMSFATHDPLLQG